MVGTPSKWRSGQRRDVVVAADPSVHEVQVKKSIASRLPDAVVARRPSRTASGDGVVGSPEHLHSTFQRAVAAADRAVGLWIAQMSAGVPGDFRSAAPDESASEARASATAYVRQLRDAGVTPERMVVLVKEAAGRPSSTGIAARELTAEMVRWSRDAYFSE